MLEDKAKNPIDLHQYLYRIYEHFNALVNPLDGESRDILNRIRKFNRSSRLGNYYGVQSRRFLDFLAGNSYPVYRRTDE